MKTKMSLLSLLALCAMLTLAARAQDVVIDETVPVEEEAADGDVMSEVAPDGTVTVLQAAPPVEPEVPAEQAPEAAQEVEAAATVEPAPILISPPEPEPQAQAALTNVPPINSPEGAVVTLQEEFVNYSTGPSAPLVPETRAAGDTSRITINLDNVSLEDTIRMFGQTAGANIIAAPNMFTGLYVSVSLNDVEWIPALRSILEIHNFTLEERTQESGVFTIKRRSSEAPEPTLVKTYFLDYTTSGEVGDPVRQILTPNRSNDTRSINFLSRNALVVRSTEKNIGEIDKLIGELDRPGSQILIEAQIMELSDQASKQLGIRWDALEELQISAGLGPATYDKTSEDKTTRIDSDIATSSRNQNRVRTENNNSANASSSSLVFPGIFNSTDTSSSGDSESDNTTITDSDVSTKSRSAVDNFTETIARQQTAILEMSELKLVLSALEKVDGVSIVSNPKMIVTSGSTNAFFRVGDREPIIRQEVTKGTDASPGDTIVAKLDTEIETDFIRGGYLETGIDLGVVATVKSQDFIEAYIKPVLRRLIGQKTVEGNSWPIISVKEIGTTFTLRSGQTVAIGGLTDTQDDKVVTRIPVLGSIPVIGRLFSHTKDVKKQIETIIFVTLSIADPNNLSTNAGIPADAELVHQRLKARAAKAEAAAALTEKPEAPKPEKKKQGRRSHK